MLTSRAATQIVGLGAGLALVRLLPDPSFGAYSVATTSLGLAGIIADLGLDSILTREIARNPAAAPALVRRANRLRAASSLVITALLVIAAGWTSMVGRLDLLLIGGLSLLPRSMLRTEAAVLVGQGRVRDAARIEALAGLSSAILSVALVAIVLLVAGVFPAVDRQGRGEAGQITVDGATLAVGALLLGNGVGLVLARRLGGAGSDTSRDTNRGASSASRTAPGSPPGSLVEAALPFVIVGLAGAAFQSLDIYVVSAVHSAAHSAAHGVHLQRAGGPDPVALYAAPFRILHVLLLVPTAWGVVALPHYARLVRDGNPDALRSRWRRDTRAGALVGLALSVGAALLAYPLTQVGLGATYLPAAPILAVLGWMALPVCLSAPLIALLTATDRQRRIAICVTLAGGLALAANLAWGGGWAQAAGASPATHLVGVAAIKVVSMAVLLLMYRLAAL